MNYKTCSKCKGQFPSTTDYFKARKDSKDGLRSQCIECENERRKEYYKNHSEHIKSKSKRWRLNNQEYANEWKKQHYRKNKEKWQESFQKRYRENKEEILAYQDWYRRTHKDEINAYFEKYRNENKELLSTRKKLIYRKYRDKYIMKTHRREAHKKELPYHLTKSQWEKCKKYFDYKCAYCGESKPLAQEHFIALDNGGEYTKDNILPACKSCNSSKRNKDFYEWYPSYKYYSKTREQKLLQYLGYKNNTQQLSIL